MCAPAFSTGTSSSSPSLQLLLQLSEEAPIGALGDELLRACFDHPSLVKTEGIKAHRVLRVELPPLVIRQFLHGLQGVLVVLCVTIIYQEPSRALRVRHADVSGFENRT